MIKVIIGYRAHEINSIIPILFKLRKQAMSYPGFIQSELLVSENDPTLIAVGKTWGRINDWIEWRSSAVRQSIIQEARRYLLEEPRVTIYSILTTETSWEGLPQ